LRKFNHLAKLQYQQNKACWKKSFLTGWSQDHEGSSLPWMSYNFIDFISQKLQPHHEIFEFGSGSSTLFFAKSVKKIIAIESNKKWHEIMQIKLLEEKIDNVELLLMPDAMQNKQYENCAANIGKFDFIFVDSLKRFECIKNSIEALKPNGAIILDDSERKNYQKIFTFLEEKKFLRQDFIGIAPGQFYLKNTSFFTKALENK